MNKTIRLLGTFAIAALITLAFASCGDGDGAQVKTQSKTITPHKDVTMTVTGNFTDAEWAGVTGKIESVLATALIGAPAVVITQYAKCKSIIVEKTSAYTNWKTNSNDETIYINYALY